MPYAVKLEQFEGPLDLLLHLIRKNEMDIYHIPIAEITAQYLATIDAMQSLNLDVAGEFLLMAATLLHLKSRLLLPQAEEETGEEEEEDPRAELVRRLLEYQKYKEAAGQLDARLVLGRDVFSRRFPSPELAALEEDEFQSVGIYELVEVLRDMLSNLPKDSYHEVTVEQLSVTERINQIMSSLAGREQLPFADLFSARPNRAELIVTFLAMLELVKLRMVRLLQNTRFGTIWLFPAVAGEALENLELDEDHLGYA
ncbi:MAG: segregation/condensation protein A [Desulfuromonadaceae bacterium]|jgi:segregation and condensation protein A